MWKEGRVLDAWTKRDKKFYPHVFVHVEGEEKVLTVSTEDGNEQSKSNEAELDQVVNSLHLYLLKKQNCFNHLKKKHIFLCLTRLVSHNKPITIVLRVITHVRMTHHRDYGVMENFKHCRKCQKSGN